MTGKFQQQQNRNLSDYLPKRAVYLYHLETKGPHRHRQVPPGSKWWLAQMTLHKHHLTDKVHETTLNNDLKLLY